ncbi:MAG: SDR family oxidoreductase [Actinobacteria bacterium]|nr:SDR family oxidoreductase [Actinomycetota bacterium]
MAEPRPIRDLVVAVTGAARGIGRATAARLAGEGARVAIGDLDATLAEAAAASVGAGAIGLPLDVTDRSSFEAFVDSTEDRLGPLDVLVNNAGILLMGPFLDEEDAATAREVAVNLFGVIHGMRVVLPRMRARGRGQVVNIASGASFVAPPGEATYAATKHAVAGLTEGVRAELRGTGVELTLVFPGLVNTELAAGSQPTRGMKWLEPDTVATAVVSAIAEPRPEVFVPRSLAATLKLNKVLPPRARESLGRFFRLDQFATGADPAKRADYNARIRPGA